MDKKIREKFAMLMLKKLGDKTLRRIDWETLCFRVMTRVSYSAIRTTLQYLLGNKYIERVERGIYRMTPLGKEALELWKKTYNKDNMEEKN